MEPFKVNIIVIIIKNRINHCIDVTQTLKSTGDKKSLIKRLMVKMSKSKSKIILF